MPHLILSRRRLAHFHHLNILRNDVIIMIENDVIGYILPAGQQTNCNPIYISGLLSQVERGANECNSNFISEHVLKIKLRIRSLKNLRVKNRNV